MHLCMHVCEPLSRLHTSGLVKHLVQTSASGCSLATSAFAETAPVSRLSSELSPLHPAFSPLLLFSLALCFQDAVSKRPCHVNSTHTPVSHPPFALLSLLGKHANLCFQKVLLTCVYICFESRVFEHELEPAGSHLGNTA